LSIINAFAANSTQGLVRGYNEDRVSILINVLPDPSKAHTAWPKCYLFAVYDGHGGSNCADFLRDNLHKEILQSEHFPGSPKAALQNAIYKIEKQFCNYSLEGKLDHSGSCLSLVLFVGMNDK
jgi:protein phosphatase 2C family protein 2/3